MVAVKTVVHGLVDFIQNYSRKGHETPQVSTFIVLVPLSLTEVHPEHLTNYLANGLFIWLFSVISFYLFFWEKLKL